MVVGLTGPRSNNRVPLPPVKCLTKSPAIATIVAALGGNSRSSVANEPARLPNLMRIICWALGWTFSFSGDAPTIAEIDGRTPGAADASAVARAGSATAIALNPFEIFDARVKGQEIPCRGPSRGPSAGNGFSLPRAQSVASLERHRRIAKDGVSWVESFRFGLDILTCRCWLALRLFQRQEKMETYLEGIAGKINRFLPFLQGTSPLNWALDKGIGSHVTLRWHKR